MIEWDSSLQNLSKLTQFGVHSFDAVLMKVKVKGAKFALQNFILESQN